jgi:hypothetical protein
VECAAAAAANARQIQILLDAFLNGWQFVMQLVLPAGRQGCIKESMQHQEKLSW